jgi:hypothetical protein
VKIGLTSFHEDLNFFCGPGQGGIYGRDSKLIHFSYEACVLHLLYDRYDDLRLQECSWSASCVTTYSVNTPYPTMLYSRSTPIEIYA